MSISFNDAVPSQHNLIKALLKRADIMLPPTDPEAIAKVLNLKIVKFGHNNEFGITSKRIRAFLSPKDRLIGVHENLIPVQERFSILHEIGHFLLPGHMVELEGKDGIIQDDSWNLSVSSNSRANIIGLEIEANQFAADCLFQLDSFDKIVHRKSLEWVNIIEASEIYGASIEATARRWIEKSRDCCALLVFRPARRPIKSPPLETMYTITSELFETQYFSTLPVGYPVGEDSLIHKFFYRIEYYGAYPDTILIVNLNNKEYTFSMKLFTNQYRVFGILTPEDN